MNGTAVYSAGLMSQSFWFLEFKKAVKLRQDGLGYDEIKKKSLVTSGKKLMGDVAQLKNATEFFAAIDKDRDDYLDFAEDYEPVKKFFAGEQISIFDRAIRLMAIYDDSRTFIVNDEIESTVAQVKAIMKKQAPYTEIKNLPGLLDQFMTAYSNLLTEMEAPIVASIDEARSRVFQELEDKLCKPFFCDKYIQRFSELHEKASTCNNVATLQNIKVEADALKVRCLNEIANKENELMAQKAAEEAVKENQVTDVSVSYGDEGRKPSVSKIKKQRTISIKSINAETTWQLETAEDIKRYITELEKKLMEQIQENTIIHIEF